MSSVNGEEGVALNLDIKLLIDFLEYTDCDGDGGSCPTDKGYIQLGSGGSGVIIDDGTGGTVNLRGLTIDSTPNGLSADSNGSVVIGLPNQTLSLSVDETYLGDKTNSAFSMNIKDFDLGGANIGIEANSS